eukprot:6526088-Prymnesium_polylepis.2
MGARQRAGAGVCLPAPAGAEAVASSPPVHRRTAHSRWNAESVGRALGRKRDHSGFRPVTGVA